MRVVGEARIYITPGPWQIFDNPKSDFIDIEPMICRIERMAPQDMENARLIAAAPELLEACRYMHKLLVDMGHGGLAGAVLGENAIAKAEGRT